MLYNFHMEASEYMFKSLNILDVVLRYPHAGQRPLINEGKQYHFLCENSFIRSNFINQVSYFKTNTTAGNHLFVVMRADKNAWTNFNSTCGCWKWLANFYVIRFSSFFITRYAFMFCIQLITTGQGMFN